MKKHYLLFPAALLLAGAAHAQGTELFFSEYNEGAHQTGTTYGGTTASQGQERAIEIFNPTRNTVNMDAYSMRRYSNGTVLGSPAVEEERLIRTTGANSLARQTTFVVANPTVTLPDILRATSMLSAPRQSGVGAAHPGVLQVGGTVHFNGDDAMALVRYPSNIAGQPNVAAGVIVDIFGVIGEQPTDNGGAWSSGAIPNNVTSANQSLVRKPNISNGVRTNPLPQNVPGSMPIVRTPGGYDIAAEWTAFSSAYNGPPVPPSTSPSLNPGGQSYANLGSHAYTGPVGTYGPLATLEKFNNGISLYPNPASGTATVELKDVKVGSIVVINNLGQRIEAQPVVGAQRVTLDVSGLKTGLYFVKFTSADGQTTIYKTLQVQ